MWCRGLAHGSACGLENAWGRLLAGAVEPSGQPHGDCHADVVEGVALAGFGGTFAVELGAQGGDVGVFDVDVPVVVEVVEVGAGGEL